MNKIKGKLMNDLKRLWSRPDFSQGTAITRTWYISNVQHSTLCKGKRGNAAGAHFGRNPFRTGRFWSMVMLQFTPVAWATPCSLRRALNQERHGRDRAV
jgi:hypothetical protein